MNKTLFLISFLFVSIISFSQTQLTWKNLEDLKYVERKYSEEFGDYVTYPTFGESLKSLEGEVVYLRGHMLNIDIGEKLKVLSRYPYASCFFCGTGGPESIVEINFKSKNVSFDMDQVLTIKGVLKLNVYDLYKCMYIFDEAEVYDE